MKTEDVSIVCMRPKAARNDYLVRGIGRRAINVSRTFAKGDMTEFELYWVIHAVATEANKRGWKHVRISIPYLDRNSRYVSQVFATNCKKHSVLVGDFNTVSDRDHFLNDDYYSPKGFWIQPYRKGKV